MSKPKKLDLEFSKLIEITNAINKNIIANKIRTKDKRITTDKFLKNVFNINRKNFSYTIKDTPIEYNPSTFIYDIPEEYQSNTLGNTKSLHNDYSQSNYKVLPSNNLESNTKVTIEEVAATKEEGPQHMSNTKVILKELLQEEYPDLKQMLEWYKDHKNNTINTINLDNPKLSGNIISKSFKTYDSVLNDFINFCKNKKQTQKDLIALALVEFMQKYK